MNHSLINIVVYLEAYTEKVKSITQNAHFSADDIVLMLTINKNSRRPQCYVHTLPDYIFYLGHLIITSLIAKVYETKKYIQYYGSCGRFVI